MKPIASVQEKPFATWNGPVMLALLWVLAIAGFGGVIKLAKSQIEDRGIYLSIAATVSVGSLIGMAGFFTVNPNEAQVITLFGAYKGAVRQPGLHWASIFLTKKRVTLRTQNFETNHLKVNDHDGNPVEIAAVVVWRVVDAAEAVFQVENYHNFVTVQSEAALRNLATAYPYDAHLEGQMSLRANAVEIAGHLKEEIRERLQVAGVEIVEARISHLAYAPEIAAAMLQRQQASAIIAARQKIVEGAVGMVEMALEMLAKKAVVDLDEERKAAMVSNLLVVLCGERSTQPVVNTGTLHH
jgi:regulator of protease activity HflC (stomatin/prohibitin superfamily)